MPAKKAVAKKAVAKKVSTPEVLVIGPADPKDMSFRLYVDMMVEYGIYLEADDQDRFPTRLPRKLTGYKAIIIDKALPAAQEIEKHPDWPKVKDRYRPYVKPKEFAWSDQRPYWVGVHHLLMVSEVTPQHPAVLARLGGRRDRDVVMGQVKNCWTDKDHAMWLRWGNDVSFVWLDGMYRAGEVFGDAQVKKNVVSAAHDILDLFEQDRLPSSKGPNRRLHCWEFLLTLWEKTGRRDRRLYQAAITQVPTLAAARKRAAEAYKGAPYFRAEHVGHAWTYAVVADVLKQPAFFEAGVDYLKGAFDALFDRHKSLWAHYGRKGVSLGLPWGRGQAWCLYGLVELLCRLPKSHPDYELLASWVDMTCEGMRRTQDPVTGLWHTVMGEPATRIEVSSAGMLLRLLSRAWRHGCCRAEFVPEMLAAAWRGLKAHTFQNRTCTFCWGTGEGYDAAFYANVPFVGGASYVKAFGPLA
jgi:rhamnogalacturonyl hydrolase YesR